MSSRTITVSGHGKIASEPDVAEIRVTAQGLSMDPREAQSLHAAELNSAIQIALGLGISRTDLVTTGYSLDTLHDYERKVRVFKGYRAKSQLTVKVRELDTVGRVISELVRAGIREVDSVTFTREDKSEMIYRAFEEAAKDARNKAEAIARGMGVEIKGVVSVSEPRGAWRPPSPYVIQENNVLAESAAPIYLPGNVESEATVEVVFEF